MWPVSERFLNTLKKSHIMHSKAEVYREGQFIQELQIHDGQVSFDYNALIQRTMSITLGDPDGSLTPSELTDLLTVAGNEIKLYRGVIFPDGEEELVPLGVFVIDVNNITESGDGHTLHVEGDDRASRISASKFTTPYTITAGTLVTDAIHELLHSRWNSVEVEMQGSEEFVTADIIYDVDKDPWEAAVELAKDIGCDLAPDGDGIFVCRPVEDCRERQVDYTYAEGDESLLLYIVKRWTNKDLINWWIVNGESTDDNPPVFAQAYDDDPSSPTYVYGPHGIHLDRHKSNQITTEDQAQTVADSLLFRSLGSYEDIRISTIVNPAHELNDCIHIVRDRVGVDGNYIIDKMTIPLVAERAMEHGTRKQ